MGVYDLEVQMGAKLNDFESGMDKAVSIAERAVSDIERKFGDLNPSFGDGFASGLLGGAAAGISGILAFASKMNSELAEMDRLARQAGLTLERYQGVQFAAALNGVSGESYAAGLEKAVSLLNDAQRNENTLLQLFNANGLSIRSNNGQLITTNQLLARSADLMQRAATEQDKIKIAQMLGFTREWVPVLEQGAKAFEKQSQEAQRLGLIIDRETIEKAAQFDKEWKASAAFWSANFRAAAADILPHINELIDAASKIFTRDNLLKFGRDGIQTIENLGVPKELNITIPEKAIRFLDELRQGLRTELGIDIQIRTPQQIIDAAFRQLRTPETLSTATDEGSGAGLPLNPRATQLKVNKPTIIPPKDTGGSDEGRDAFENSISSAERRIAVLNAETATIGLNSEARERARLVAVLEEAAKRANTDAGLANTAVTAEQRVQIDQLATAMEGAARRNREMSEAMNNYRELGSAAAEAFKGLTLEGKKFNEVLSQLLNRLASRAIDSSFSNLFGSLGRMLGGSLFGGGGELPGFGTSSFIGPLPGNARGTDNWRGGPTWVGEEGPEIVNVPRGAQIIPNNLARRTGGGPVTVSMPISVDARGATQGVGAEIEAAVRRATAQIVPTVQDAQARGILR